MSNNRRRNGNRPRNGDNDGSNLPIIREFRFTHKGRTYTLPPASEAMKSVKADTLIDAALNNWDNEEVQSKFSMSTLAVVLPMLSADTVDALRDMSMVDFGALLSRWLRKTGADLGKSDTSSASQPTTLRL